MVRKAKLGKLKEKLNKKSTGVLFEDHG